ncbi:hypothetical protein G5I_05272 [Acromyrmex echinatior]|uniref:Uncharacterized protein n=1 Tax=Acromyrmex echinatior TaxID=103372 RepID=F4WI03_ACREC|nr:hypothetical protein G5I_05272 [Acromyrmex echinatior]
MMLMNKLLSNSIEDQLERSFRTCLSMTGVHLIFLIRDYTSSSESASTSKCTRWAFRDVSNPSGTLLQSDNAMVVVGTRHNNLTEELILPSFFPFFLSKQRGRRGREGRRSENFLTEERIEFRFGSPAVVRLLRHLLQCATKDFREAEEALLFNEPYTVPGRQDDVTAIKISSYFSHFFLFHYRTGGTFNELSLSKRNEDEAHEIFRTGVDYLGGSFLELRAVTTNRMLETKEVQAAAVCFGAVSYFTLNINIAATRCTYYASTVYYEKYISQILKTRAEEPARHSSDKIRKLLLKKMVYVNVSRTNDSWDRCSPASFSKTWQTRCSCIQLYTRFAMGDKFPWWFKWLRNLKATVRSETDPTIEQVYNGFCRGGNDCNHHSSLGKWKFGSPTLPLFNTVDSNDCPWTEGVEDERGKIGGPAKRLKEIKREEELRKNVLRDRVNEGKYLLNYYRLLAETRRSKCHGDRVEKSVVKEDIVTVGREGVACWGRRERKKGDFDPLLANGILTEGISVPSSHHLAFYRARTCDLRCVMRRRLMSSAVQRQRVDGVVREVQQGLEENASSEEYLHSRTKYLKAEKITEKQIYASIHEKAKAENGKSLPPRIQLNEMKL